jgi:hypothetical protein
MTRGFGAIGCVFDPTESIGLACHDVGFKLKAT